MTIFDFIQLLPLVILGLTAAALLFVMAVSRSGSNLTFFLTLAGLFTACLSLPIVTAVLPRQVMFLLVVDRFTVVFTCFILLSAMGVVLLSFDYLKPGDGRVGEFYLLLLLGVAGGVILVSSIHFVSFFLGLETLSIALYGLIAYCYTRTLSIEAAVKYLILSAASSAFLLFGMALIYSQTGSMEFHGIVMRMLVLPPNAATLAGTLLLLVGLGFKLGLVPFHMWTPDVYQGAPAPVSAFIATVSKGSVFALMLRYFPESVIENESLLFLIFSIMAGLSMLTGNFLALFQKNLKRLLAYSSIAHFGYLLTAFLAAGVLRVAATVYYLAAYSIALIGAFGVVALMSRGEKEAEEIDEYRGLYRSKPFLAITMTAMLLSLAGIPLTAGFIAKFLLVTAGLGSALTFLVILLVLNSAVSVFYYLRVILVLFDGTGHAPSTHDTAAPASTLVLAVALVLLLWWGLYPSWLIRLIQGG